ncbi:MAG: hypothetical protein WKG01_30020 [Kofleriaceae bacterium]
MSEAASRLRKALLERVVQAKAKTTPAARRQAFDNRDVPEAARALLDKVANHAWKVTDEDVAAARAAGLSEDQIFELVACTAFGHSARQLEAALAALAVATQEPR